MLRARLNGGIRNKAARRGLPAHSSGTTLMVNCASMPIRLSLPSFTICLRASPRWDRHVAFASGFIPKGSHFRGTCTPLPSSAGSMQAAIPPGLDQSRRCRCLYLWQKRAKRYFRWHRRARSGFDPCRSPNGRFSSASTIEASPIGRPMKQVSNVSPEHATSAAQGRRRCERGRPPARSCQLQPSLPTPAYPLSWAQILRQATTVLAKRWSTIEASIALNNGGVQIDDAIDRGVHRRLISRKADRLTDGRGTA